MKLQTKFFGALLPASLAAAALIVFLIAKSVHSALLDGLEQNAVVLARAAAQDAAPGLALRSERRLLPVLQSLQRRQGAYYAEALDLAGRVLAHTTTTETGKRQNDDFTRAALRSNAPMTRRFSVGSEPALEVSVPVWSRAASPARLGILKAGVPLHPVLETERRIIRNISTIVVAIGSVTFLFMAFFVRSVLRPVRSLTEGISRVGRGQYDVKVPVRSSDELGELANSFNRMSEELARTTVSKEYVEAILETMLDPLVVADAEGRIRSVNRAAAETLRCAPADLIGRPLSALFVGPSELARETFAAEVEAGKIRDREVLLAAKAGEPIPALFSASALRDARGRVQSYVGTAKDITERKRGEEALVAAKAAAEASSRELEAFSYSVAHDLRAPLRAIDGFSRFLLEGYASKLDVRGRDFLARVRGGSLRMGQLIDDLLNLSRITRSAMRVEEVDLSALAAEISAELRKSQPRRRVEFDISPGVKARGDANLLRVALVNLLGNAWKYTSKHASARIAFGVDARGGGGPAYFVKDDGAGFDMAFSKRLFQPFTRLHATAQFEGTGIGLAIVQRVIARHEGRAWAEGRIEGGATFYFTLWEAKG